MAEEEDVSSFNEKALPDGAFWGDEEDDLLLSHLILYIDEKVIVKLHCNRELHGKLHAIDKECNMILGNVTEIATSVGIDDETFEETEKTTRRTFPFLFVRGEHVILVSAFLGSAPTEFNQVMLPHPSHE